MSSCEKGCSDTRMQGYQRVPIQWLEGLQLLSRCWLLFVTFWTMKSVETLRLGVKIAEVGAPAERLEMRQLNILLDGLSIECPERRLPASYTSYAFAREKGGGNTVTSLHSSATLTH